MDGNACYARLLGRNYWSMMQRLGAAKIDARMIYRERLRGLVGDIP